MKDNEIAAHDNNIYSLEMYNLVNGTSPEIMNDVFQTYS